MSKIKIIFGIVVAALTVACEGPAGVDGLNGLDGLDGARAEVYQQTLNFAYDAEFNTWSSEVISFNGALAGDVYLGYVSLGDNLFTSLPASFFDEFGEFQYVFDHNFDSVQFQIIGDNDLSALSVNFTNNIVTRIAIIPADLFSESNFQGTIAIENLMNEININEEDIILQ